MLFDGKDEEAQSWLSSSGDGGCRSGQVLDCTVSSTSLLNRFGAPREMTRERHHLATSKETLYVKIDTGVISVKFDDSRCLQADLKILPQAVSQTEIAIRQNRC